MISIMNGTVIPAQPGFSVVSGLVEDGVIIGLDYEPVIAWQIPLDGFPRAITPSGLQPEEAGIKQPDGRIAFFPFVTVADEAGALEYLREQDRERATEAMGDGFARAH